MRPLATLSRPSRRAAQQPSRRAAQPPSRPVAKPPSSRAAQQPSRQAAEPPSSRAVVQPSCRAAQPPSRPTTEPPEQPRPGDGLSLFDLTSGASPAPAADADATVHSPWATRDAAARLAVRRHLPTSELTRLPDSLCVVRDHFLSVCPTTLTVDLLGKSLLAAEKSILAVGTSRGDRAPPSLRGVPPPPFCPLLPLLLWPTSLVLSRSMRRLPLAGDPALARARGAGALEERAGAVEVEVEAAGGVGMAVGVEVGVEVSGAAVEAQAAVAVGVEVAEVAAVEEAAEAAVVAEAAEAVEVAVELVAGLPRGVVPVVVPASSSSAVVRSCPLSSSVSGTLHASGVGVLVRAPTSCAPATVRVSSVGVRTPPNPGIETSALGIACEAAALGACDAAALVLPCPTAPSGTLSGLYLPSFSTNLVSGADLQDGGMASRLLVSGLPRSLPPLPHGPGPTCVPCVEGRQRAAPHSSQFPPTEAPLQTLHMDVWGPARVRGQGHERYFPLVVDDYSRYTAVFPLRSKGDVTEVLIDWIHAACLQLRQSFGSDFPVLRLHSDRGGEFSSGLLRAYCRARGILQTFTLLDSPQQNGIAERRIGMVMDVARSPPVDPLPPQGPAPSGVSQVDAVEPVEVTGDSGAAEGAEPGGAEPWGAESVGAATRGAELGGAEPGGAVCGGAEPGGADPGSAEPGGAATGGAEPRGTVLGVLSLGVLHLGVLSLGELREWFARRWSRAARAGGSSATEGAAVPSPGGARTGSTGAAGPAGPTGAGAAEGVGAEATAVGPGGGPAGGATGAARGTGAGGAAGAGAAAGVLVLSLLCLDRPPHSLLLLPTLVLLEVLLSVVSLRLVQRRLSVLHALVVAVRVSVLLLSLARTGCLYVRQLLLCVPLCLLLLSPLFLLLPTRSRALFCAASPTVTRLLATIVTDPSFESTAAPALVAELVDFAARCRLDYAASLVAESEKEEFQCLAAASPHLVSVLLTPEGDPDALDIPTPRSYAEAIEGPYSSQWQAAMETEMTSWKSTGTYVDEVPPPGANIVSGMWIFRVKRPPGSPPVFKARNLARGFSQRQGVNYFQTFSPTPKMTTLQVLLHVAAHRDYELHSLDFNTAFLQGIYGLRQAPHEWYDPLRTTLAALGFAPSTADPSLFLRTDTSLPPFYILVYVDDLVFATADTDGLAYVKSELQKRHTCTDLEHMAAAKRVLRYLCSTSGMGLVLGGRSPVVLTGHAHASWADNQSTQRSSQGYTFSLGSGSVSWRATRSSSVLSSSCEAEIYAGAMAAQELRWLTYRLTDLGEPPRSPPVLYVDNKAMLALCREHRLEHRTKHIALRYFLARELQQRGQLRLAYVASEANSADVFTKALAPCDHQRFCTQLGLVPVLPHLLTS
ncbi:unnamed protein product [Closterium sp. NIES-64]|nr:unnamed protein product [Closterium sp. NIES-64]